MARMTATERLGRQGVAHIEVDGLLARLTKRQSALADVAAYERAATAVALAAPLALAMRHRVRDQRMPAQGSLPGYGRRRAIMSREYAGAAGLDRTYYPSSQAMHDALPHRRAYDVTGGMWRGLQVRGSGASAAVIDFGGSSLSRGEVTFRRGRGGIVVRAAKVRNGAKAGAIFSFSKINVLEPRHDEVDTIAGQLGEWYGAAVVVGLDGEPVIGRAASGLAGDVRAALLRGYRGGTQ